MYIRKFTRKSTRKFTRTTTWNPPQALALETLILSPLQRTTLPTRAPKTLQELTVLTEASMPRMTRPFPADLHARLTTCPTNGGKRIFGHHGGTL